MSWKPFKRLLSRLQPRLAGHLRAYNQSIANGFPGAFIMVILRILESRSVKGARLFGGGGSFFWRFLRLVELCPH